MSRALRTVAVSFRVSGTNLSENPQPAKMRRCTGNRTNFICLEPKVPGQNQKEKIIRKRRARLEQEVEVHQWLSHDFRFQGSG